MNFKNVPPVKTPEKNIVDLLTVGVEVFDNATKEKSTIVEIIPGDIRKCHVLLSNGKKVSSEYIYKSTADNIFRISLNCPN